MGSYTIDAQYIDGSSGTYASSKGTATLKVTNVTIAPTTLTAITVGAAIATQTLVASGGTGPYTYAVTLGALPLGISLSPSGATAGQLTGTATEGGSIGFTVTATDSLGATGIQAYTWTVNPPTITLTPVSGPCHHPRRLHADLHRQWWHFALYVRRGRGTAHGPDMDCRYSDDCRNDHGGARLLSDHHHRH